MKKTALSLLLLLSALTVACTELVPRSVAGRIFDEVTGAPISGVEMIVGGEAATSDNAGHYEVAAPRETDEIEVSANGYYPKAVVLSSLPPDTNLQELDIVLAPYVLSGMVVDIGTKEPIRGAVVTAGVRHAVTDDEGRYAIHALPPGTTLRARADGYHPSWETIFHGESEHDFMLRPVIVTVSVRDAYSGVPLPGVEIRAGDVSVVTDDEGRALLRNPAADVRLTADKDRYASTEAIYKGEAIVSLTLRPSTLEGTVRGGPDGAPVEGALVLARLPGGENSLTHTGGSGRFSLDDLPSSFTLLVKSPGYRRVEMELDQTTSVEIALERFEVRGVYLAFGHLANEEKVLEIIEMVERTELNAIVLDVKGDRAWLAYPSKLPVAIAVDSYANELDLMDLDEFLRLCKERDIYTIARIVVFKDNVLAQAKPEWAIHHEDGGLWQDLEGLCWTDPFRREVWSYNLGIAKEVIALGFDEVQFDYIRFPSDGDYWTAVYTEERSFESRTRIMKEFCQYIEQELEPTGAFYSADLYGMTPLAGPDQDMGIGQLLEDFALYFDYLSPMVYPSTFRGVAFSFGDPLLHPYEVVYHSCLKALERTDTKIRPYLQHYSLYGIVYGTKEILAQKQAAEDAGTCGWLFWKTDAAYNVDVFGRAEDPKD